MFDIFREKHFFHNYFMHSIKMVTFLFFLCYENGFFINVNCESCLKFTIFEFSIFSFSSKFFTLESNTINKTYFHFSNFSKIICFLTIINISCLFSYTFNFPDVSYYCIPSIFLS